MTKPLRQQSQDKDELLGVPEAAHSYNFAEGTLRYLIHLKAIPSYKLGRRRKLKRSDIEAYIESHREEAF